MMEDSEIVPKRVGGVTYACKVFEHMFLVTCASVKRHRITPFGTISTIFHHQYRNLEKAVEDLSQLLEEPIEADTVKDLRMRMMIAVRFDRITKRSTDTDSLQVYVQKTARDPVERHRNSTGEGKWEWVAHCA